MSASTTSKQFWRTDWFVGLLIVVAVLALQYSTEIFETLERRFYDIGSVSTSRQASERIAVIAIDDQSIANIGQWPWPRDIQAQLIDKLALAKPKVITDTVFFFEPQTDRGLQYIRKIKDLIGPAGDVSNPQTALNEQLAKLIAEAESSLDTDVKLGASMAKAGNVLTPSFFELGEPLGKADKPLPAYALKSAFDENKGLSFPATTSKQPIELIGVNAAGIGHMNTLQDRDGAVRQEALLVNYFGKAIPSMALLTAMKSLNLSPADIQAHAEGYVQLGRLQIKTNVQALMLPQFYPMHNDKPAFAVDSFYDVLSGKIAASKYADKIVIIGATATGVGTLFPVPGYAGLSPAETMAHITSSILNEHFIVQPNWGVWAGLAAYLLVAAYLLMALPRLSAGKAALATLLLFILLLGTEFGLLSQTATWLKLVLPAALLLLGHLGLTTKRFLVTETGKQKADEESAETNRMMGLALQGQGQLEMAFDRFRRVPYSDAVMDNMGNLALDFERKRQFNKAQAVYEYMATVSPGYKGLAAKLSRVKNLSETVILGSSHAGGSMRLHTDGVEKPMLGRYQVEKELGKGAMGVVYMGKDPKIGRVVAIKTLALSEEFAGDDLIDARERFFREAETAGRLQHQNIVTIFDAGEEHDLAYIAMEFLKGQDLVNFCKEGQLLSVATVLEIVAQVADALAYAHQQNVVHRDIKPANIMYDLATKAVKVTDFGIARITDSSRTKTGLVLGTPSFMSPEQIAGKKVDGRSDLYSLGVMLFQMLSGVLPLRGDSMAELMFKIANEEPVDIRSLRPGLPAPLSEIVARSMRKQPDARYQDGKQFAADLRNTLHNMTGAAPLAQHHASATNPTLALQTLQTEREKMPQNAASRLKPEDKTVIMTAVTDAATMAVPVSALTNVPGVQASAFAKTTVIGPETKDGEHGDAAPS